MSAVLSVPAGRAIRRGETKWVDADAEKGTIEIRLEDELTHFSWRSRVSGNQEEDLIIFPGEATFEKVEQDPSGRTHVLKFSSSAQKHFRSSAEGDLRAQVDINALLQDPSYRPGTAELPARSTTSSASGSGGSAIPSTPLQPQQERSWPPTPGAPRLSHPEPAPRASSFTGAAASGDVAATPTPAAAGSSTAAQSEIVRLMAEWAQQGGLSEVEDDARLTDVLSSANISTLLASRPDLVSTLTPLLPPGLSLPASPSASDLLPILSAPQFTDAIASLDSALRNGGLPGGILRDIGLPEGAGRNVKAFLDALVALKQDTTEQGSDERMDED